MPAINLSTTTLGQTVAGEVCAARVTRKTTREGKPFLEFELRDRHLRTMRGVKWTVGPEESYDGPVVVYLEAEVREYKGDRELAIGRCEITDGDTQAYLPDTYRAREDLEADLWRLVSSVDDVGLRRLLETALYEARPDFLNAPASITYHGAYPGGLLEHSVQVATISATVAEVYGEIVDRDLLVTGALLHDIGKCGNHPSHDPGHVADAERLTGHLVQGALLVDKLIDQLELIPEGRKQDLLHLIVSHHGEHEWGAPVTPATPEAFILHYADQIDATVTGHRDLFRASATDREWVYFPMRRRHVRQSVAQQQTPAAGATVRDFSDLAF